MISRPLSSFPVVQSMNPGSLRDAVDGLTEYDHGVVRSAHQTRGNYGVVNGLRLNDMSLVYVAYAMHVSVLAPPTKAQVLLVIPLGPMRVDVAGRAETLTVPFVLSASLDTTMYPDAGAGALVGAVPMEVLTGLLAASFGTGREFAVDLAHPRPIPLSAGTALRRIWLGFAADPAAGDADDLLDSLLIGLMPYIKSGMNELEPRQPPPDYLVAAAHYLRKRYSEQVSLVQLSEAVGIGSRQLQLAFQVHFDCTAQEYLKRARLDRAHSLLSSTHDGCPRTVASIGAEVGISHPGRFGQYFFERFGVLPSDLVATLK